ncbi:phage tail protein I [Exilibacterium tricleocarpae]|nr:phage tail protein I [Exilibacterium tricleocarpae]
MDNPVPDRREHDLLPVNATALERDLALASAALHKVPVVINQLWDPYNCPDSLLPWLAWALSVDAWQEHWTAAQKRRAIAASLSIHAHRGTRRAVADAITHVLQLHSDADGDSPPDFSNAFTIIEWWEQLEGESQPASTQAGRSQPEPLTFKVILSHRALQGIGLELRGQLYNDLMQAINAAKPLTSRFRLEVGGLALTSELLLAGGISVMQMLRFTAAVNEKHSGG